MLSTSTALPAALPAAKPRIEGHPHVSMPPRAPEARLLEATAADSSGSEFSPVGEPSETFQTMRDLPESTGDLTSFIEDLFFAEAFGGSK